jgi:lipopolysaccharide/colanic/teichoic acid biosynthesis glycosyltransferase
VNFRRPQNGNEAVNTVPSGSVLAAGHRVLDEQSFHRMISLERKRAERSHNSFLLVLLDAGEPPRSHEGGQALGQILSALSIATRETDVTGWYKHGASVGVLLTAIAEGERKSIVSTILTRISGSLQSQLSFEQFRQINISFHLFPEDWKQDTQQPSNPTLYPDLLTLNHSKTRYRLVKRIMDVAGSALLLLLCAPIFALIALAIKLTSQGPVFFRQPRVGKYGIPFPMLKFRSMYANSDSSNHKEYVKRLIAGKALPQPSNGNGKGVYKITNDSRITLVGALLRKSSLDELPQLLNVLKGEMSLVGPRPPVPYEVEAYDLWHRRRLLEAKPGITGLWQVSGRNRVKFDDMVRLDLAYARTSSPWVDVKILLRTPRAVIEGAH